MYGLTKHFMAGGPDEAVPITQRQEVAGAELTVEAIRAAIDRLCSGPPRHIAREAAQRLDALYGIPVYGERAVRHRVVQEEWYWSVRFQRHRVIRLCREGCAACD